MDWVGCGGKRRGGAKVANRWQKDEEAFSCSQCRAVFGLFMRKVIVFKIAANRFLKHHSIIADSVVLFFVQTAVGQTDLSTVEKICHEGCDVHFSTTMFPPLIIAANRNVSTAIMGEGEIQCVACGMILKESHEKCTKCKAVVHRNESTKYADHAGITALHAAVQKAGHLEIVRLLIQHGAIVNAMTRKVLVSTYITALTRVQGNTPLLYAAAGGHTACCEVPTAQNALAADFADQEMLRASADPNMECTEDGDTPLHKALREGTHETYIIS
eukprot:764924-Hanusia_phi.AAC.2